MAQARVILGGVVAVMGSPADLRVTTQPLVVRVAAGSSRWARRTRLIRRWRASWRREARRCGSGR